MQGRLVLACLLQYEQRDLWKDESNPCMPHAEVCTVILTTCSAQLILDPRRGRCRGGQVSKHSQLERQRWTDEQKDRQTEAQPASPTSMTISSSFPGCSLKTSHSPGRTSVSPPLSCWPVAVQWCRAVRAQKRAARCRNSSCATRSTVSHAE